MQNKEERDTAIKKLVDSGASDAVIEKKKKEFWDEDIKLAESRKKEDEDQSVKYAAAKKKNGSGSVVAVVTPGGGGITLTDKGTDRPEKIN